jgi:purine nucleoside permease
MRVCHGHVILGKAPGAFLIPGDMMTVFSRLCALALMLVPGAVVAAPIPIKVAILTTYEHGKDTGDAPGEFQTFAERMQWDKHLHVPGVEHDVLISRDGVMGVVTGMRGRPRETMAAIISDPRFDVSHTYWIVAGIAGVDPKAATVGSAAWSLGGGWRSGVRNGRPRDPR